MLIKLSECVELLDNKRVPLSSNKRKTLNKIYPYYGAQGIIDYVDDYVFDGEYILVAEDGNNLKTLNENIATWATGKFWVNNHAHILGERKGYNLKYIFYLLNSMDITKYVTGSAQPKLNQENLLNIKLSLPNIKIQDKIVEILSGIDEQIERNNKLVKRLQVLAQTTYSRWFNQFEFPNEHGLPYRSNRGKMVWNDELKREIPDGWNVDDVLNLINWQSSSQPPKSDFSSEMHDGYIRFIQNRDYDSDTHITYIPISTNTKTCTQHDIMIDKYGDAGKTRYGLYGAYNVALAKIEPKFNNYQEYLRKYFEQEHIYRFLHKACVASTRASLNESILSGLTIVIPDNKILVLFEDVQKDIINQILNMQKENNRLQSLKNNILPLLINGQLNI